MDFASILLITLFCIGFAVILFGREFLKMSESESEPKAVSVDTDHPANIVITDDSVTITDMVTGEEQVYALADFEVKYPEKKRKKVYRLYPYVPQ